MDPETEISHQLGFFRPLSIETVHLSSNSGRSIHSAYPSIASILSATDKENTLLVVRYKIIHVKVISPGRLEQLFVGANSEIERSGALTVAVFKRYFEHPLVERFSEIAETLPFVSLPAQRASSSSPLLLTSYFSITEAALLVRPVFPVSRSLSGRSVMAPGSTLSPNPFP